jgi:hypothetical protein
LPDAGNHPLWPAIKGLLAEAERLGGIEAEPELDCIWIAFDGPTVFAAAATRLIPGDEAELRLAGGTRFREWIGLLDEAVSGWARDCGAYRLTMRGRKGWGRFARPFGWVALGADDAGRMIYEKEL